MNRTFFLYLLGALGLFSAPASAQGPGGASPSPDGAVIQLEIGNEDRGTFAPVFEPFFDNTVGEKTSDGHLSWAWRIAYTPNRTAPKWFKPFHENLFWLSDTATVRTSSSLQQSASMPDETRQKLGYKERPHAGYLAYEERINLADPLSPHTQRLDTLALTLGVIGPLSGAEAMHEASHGLTGLTSTPWSQLKNEPIANLYYERAERFFLLKSHAKENLEFMPYASAAIGNAFTYGAVGGTLRVGSYLPNDAGAYRMGPLLNSNTFAQDGDYFASNVFLGGEARAVGRNIFLDGNTYQTSHSVDKNTGVADVQMGFELGSGATRLTVINLWRTEEFVTQGQPDQLLKATLPYAY